MKTLSALSSLSLALLCSIAGATFPKPAAAAEQVVLSCQIADEYPNDTYRLEVIRDWGGLTGSFTVVEYDAKGFMLYTNLVSFEDIQKKSIDLAYQAGYFRRLEWSKSSTGATVYKVVSFDGDDTLRATATCTGSL